MELLIWIRILLLGLLSTYNVCQVSSVDCPTDRCNTHDGVTDCSYQQLSCIPCNIAATTELKMAHNAIHGLNEGDFHCFKNLKSIDLSHNQITYIADMTFRNMTEQSKTSLRYLNLQHNMLGLGLSVIQGKSFEGLSNLETLDLSFNQIRTISSKSFKGLFNLSNLLLRNNSITSLNSGDFDGLSMLRTLDLGNNKITVLDSAPFKGLDFLQTLELQNNKIQKLGANAFENTPRLKRLRIDHNELTTLDMQPFNNLKKLQHLDLSYNNLKSIGNNCFSNCSKLEYLKLNDNMLTSITKDVFGDHTLFTDLQVLLLSNNRIELIANTSLNGMKNIRYLHLDNNRIPKLQTSTFKELHLLEFLHLQHNNLVTLSEDAFDGLHELQYLDVSFNNLQVLKPTFFSDNFALKTLSISNNKISHLANATFADLVYLNAIYAEGNMIDTIQGIDFKYLNRLSILHLDQNLITTIEESTLTGLKNLVKLHLRNNRLKAFPSQVLSELKSLITVDLRENEIVTLQPPSMNQSFDLRLTGNPLSCDCVLKGMREWLSKSRNTEYLECNKPTNLLGYNIFSLKLESFQCKAPYFTKTSQNLRVEVGDDVRLFCKVEGFPEPVLKWYDIGNTEIKTSIKDFERYEILSNGILNIKNVSINDAGVYTCSATNAGGREDRTIKLNVENKDGSKAGVIGGGLFAIILVVGVGLGLYMYLWSYKRKRLVNNPSESNEQAYMSVSIGGFPAERECGSQGSIHSEVVYATIGAGGTSEENKNNEKEHGYHSIWKQTPVIKIDEESNENEPVKKGIRIRKPGSPGYMTMLPMRESEISDDPQVKPSSSTLASPRFIKNNVRKTASARFESPISSKTNEKLGKFSNVATLLTHQENAIKNTVEKSKPPKPLYACPKGKIMLQVMQLESITKKNECDRSGPDKSFTMPRSRVDSEGSRAKEPITVGSRPRRGSASKIQYSNKVYDSVVT